MHSLIENKDFDCELLCQLWTRCLPFEVQNILATVPVETSIGSLAEAADRIKPQFQALTFRLGALKQERYECFGSRFPQQRSHRWWAKTKEPTFLCYRKLIGDNALKSLVPCARNPTGKTLRISSVSQ